MARRPLTHKRGFTLIEVLVALVITGLLLAALVQAVGLATGAAARAQRYEEALSRCRSHMAALDPDIGRLAGSSTGDDGGGYRWRIQVSREKQDQDGPALLGGMALYAVAVTIDWRDGLVRHAVTLRTERLGTANG
ncbi:MAG TPA: type II secretion system protein [Stellaceae bacterium]|nr:type II secretion system protein [Stellaceae bacterium]